MDMQEFGQRVKQRRKALKLSQEQVAQRASISRSYISVIEQGGTQKVSTQILNQLAVTLEVSSDWLEGKTLSEDDDVRIPGLLRQFGMQAGLLYEVVERLARIPRPGREPKSVAEWHSIYVAVCPYIAVENEELPRSTENATTVISGCIS